MRILAAALFTQLCLPFFCLTLCISQQCFIGQFSFALQVFAFDNTVCVSESSCHVSMIAKVPGRCKEDGTKGEMPTGPALV